MDKSNGATLFLVLATMLCVQQSAAFNSPTIYKSKVAVHQCVPVAHHSLRFAAQSSSLFMASEKEEAHAPTEGEDLAPALAIIDEPVKEEKKKSKSGIVKIIPLFFKFCVVLAVKFITDVLVFPPLFMWRFVRRIFRRLTGASTGKGGATSTSSS